MEKRTTRMTMKKTALLFAFYFLCGALMAQTPWSSKAVNLSFAAKKTNWKDSAAIIEKFDYLQTQQVNIPQQDSVFYAALVICDQSGLQNYAVRILNFWSHQKVSQDEQAEALLLVNRAVAISSNQKALLQSVDYRDLLMQKALVHFYRNEFDSTQALCLQGLKLSKEAKDPFNESLFTVQNAILLSLNRGDTTVIDSLFRRAGDLASQTPSLHDDAMALHNYAYFLKSHPVQNLKRSLEVLTSIQDFSNADELKKSAYKPYHRSAFFFRGTHMLMLHELAVGYLLLGDFEQAIYYMEQCSQLQARQNGSAYLSRVLIEQAYFETYARPVSRVKALYDSVTALSLKYYGKMQMANSYIYYVKGWLDEADHNWPSAIQNYKSAIPFSDFGINENHIGLFRAYTKAGDVFHADSLYKAINDSIKASLVQHHRIYFYKELPAYYRLKKNEAQALNATVRYYQLKDSMAGISNYLIASRFEKQFKTKEKDRLLVLAEKEKQVHQQQIAFQKRQTFFLAAGFLLLSLATLLLIRNYRNKKRHAATLEQKNNQIETLIRELHHRVKNNLQVVSGLLSLQANRLEDETARQAMDEGRTRVDAMAMIHQKLYLDKDLAAVDIKEYLENLSLSLANSFGYDKNNLEVKVGLPNLSMNIDMAIPIGLIVNELVTNAFKHAFTQTDTAKIKISLEGDTAVMELKVADNGQGINTSATKSKSFGMKLMHTLVEQLNGSLQQKQDNGTVFTIQIRP